MAQRLAALLTVVLLAGCHSAAARSGGSAGSEQQIRALLDRWQSAFERRDVAGVMSVYLPDKSLTIYDVPPPLVLHGSDALRRDYAGYFARFDGPLHSELRDLHIVAGPTSGFAYYLQGIEGRLKDGTKIRRWIRVTQGYRLVEGRWLVVHDHVSVPIDPKTHMGKFDLTP